MNEALSRLSIDTFGIRTSAWQFGDPQGAPVVLVHGFRGDHHGLEGLARQLVGVHPEIRAIVPDLPGFGDTPAIPGRRHDLDLYGDWLRVCVSEVAPDARAVLGHSFGSLVVANSVSRGLDAAAVMLVNPIAAPALDGPQAVLTRLAVLYYWLADQLPERAARSLLGNRIIVRIMSEVMAKTGDRALRSWIHAQHQRYFSRFADTTTLLQAFHASVSHTVLEYATSITQPTLLIAGDRDDITPLSAQLSLQHRIRSARLRVTPGVGHLIHYEAVEDAVAWIGEFLSDVAGEKL